MKLFRVEYVKKFGVITFIVCAETQESARQKTSCYVHADDIGIASVTEMELEEGILAHFTEVRLKGSK